jgi:uncharacterized protein YodC (DUF2158 family)
MIKGKGVYSKGDTVQLKSGGPVMTVAGEESGSGIRCQWFGGKKLESGNFPVESLVPRVIDPAAKK